MLSKGQIKLITSLKQKKYRLLHKMFVAEGIKTISELLNANFVLDHLYFTEPFFEVPIQQSTLITPKQLKQISFLKTPNTALAVFCIPKPKKLHENQLVLALDNVRDPGNLGAIIRLCDWFGIHDLICNNETVDCYNPKVVQATMGSLARVNVTYKNLYEYLTKTQLPKLGAYMDGENLYNANLPQKCVLILGNEANGISDVMNEVIDRQLAIPRFGTLQETESLNVANATAILLSEFKRRQSDNS